MPLYELPVAANQKHPNFEWRGEGRGIGFFSEVTPILSPIVVAQAFALFCWKRILPFCLFFVDLWHLIPASTPCGLSLLLVFSCTPSTPVFPSPQKPTFSNSNSTRNQVDEEPLSGCTTSKSLFIYISFLAVVASGMAVVCKRCNNSQQSWHLQWIVGSIQPIRLWRPCVMRVRGRENVGRAVQTDPTFCATLRRSWNKRNVGSCWLKRFTAHQLPTTCNRVCKRTQHATANNVASVYTRLYLTPWDSSQVYLY